MSTFDYVRIFEVPVDDRDELEDAVRIVVTLEGDPLHLAQVVSRAGVLVVEVPQIFLVLFLRVLLVVCVLPRTQRQDDRRIRARLERDRHRSLDLADWGELKLSRAVPSHAEIVAALGARPGSRRLSDLNMVDSEVMFLARRAGHE